MRIDLSNPRTQRRLRREGRGHGEGPGYKPGLTVQDVPSAGHSHRFQGWKSGGRVLHFLSNLEQDFFLTLEWDTRVVDYREQFFLEMNHTTVIAERLGFQHPIHPKTRLPVQMSTDFLVTYMVDGVRRECAVAVKPHAEIETLGAKHPKRVARTLEKLQIEREYWKERNVPWALVTEKEINRVLARNVWAVHGYYHLASLAPLAADDVEKVHAWLFPKVTQAGVPLSQLALTCDEAHGYESGMSLSVVKHLIARRRWPVDFDQPFVPGECLILI